MKYSEYTPLVERLRCIAAELAVGFEEPIDYEEIRECIDGLLIEARLKGRYDLVAELEEIMGSLGGGD